MKFKEFTKTVREIFSRLSDKLQKKKSDSLNRDSDYLFRSGEVFNASNEELFSSLKELGTGFVQNDMVKHRQIIRSLTIDSIINRRHVEALENKNTQLGIVNIILSIGVIILTVWGLFKSPQAIVAQNEVDNYNRQALEFCANLPEGNWPTIGGGTAPCSLVLKTLNVAKDLYSGN